MVKIDISTMEIKKKKYCDLFLNVNFMKFKKKTAIVVEKFSFINIHSMNIFSFYFIFFTININFPKKKQPSIFIFELQMKALRDHDLWVHISLSGIHYASLYMDPLKFELDYRI